MKREQKILAMMMAATMAFAGISTTTMASASPFEFNTARLGNYIDDTQESESYEKESSSVKKVIKKSADTKKVSTAKNEDSSASAPKYIIKNGKKILLKSSAKTDNSSKTVTTTSKSDETKGKLKLVRITPEGKKIYARAAD